MCLREPQGAKQNHGMRQFEESRCSDSSHVDDTLFKFDRDVGNFRRTTGLHRRRIQGLLGGHSKPERSIPLPDGQPASLKPGLPSRHGSIPAPAQGHATHTYHRARRVSCARRFTYVREPAPIVAARKLARSGERTPVGPDFRPIEYVRAPARVPRS